MNKDRMARERDTIARRVAEFRETQARFQRAREDYYEATIEKALNIDWNEPDDRALPH